MGAGGYQQIGVFGTLSWDCSFSTTRSGMILGLTSKVTQAFSWWIQKNSCMWESIPKKWVNFICETLGFHLKFDKQSKPITVPSLTEVKDIRETSHLQGCPPNKGACLYLRMEDGALMPVGSSLFQPSHSPWHGQVCHLLSWPESGQSDMTLLPCVPSGNSTWIRYRKEDSRPIVWGLTQAVDWTVALLLCWYCWSRAHRCGTARIAEA